MQDTKSIIENNFMYHAPTGGQMEKYANLRAKAKELAFMIDEVPSGRERSLAMTNLEQAVFWANAAIARNPEKQAPSAPTQAP